MRKYPAVEQLIRQYFSDSTSIEFFNIYRMCHQRKTSFPSYCSRIYTTSSTWWHCWWYSYLKKGDTKLFSLSHKIYISIHDTEKSIRSNSFRNEDKHLPQYAYIPFGGGYQTCTLIILLCVYESIRMANLINSSKMTAILFEVLHLYYGINTSAISDEKYFFCQGNQQLLLSRKLYFFKN